MLTTIIKDVLVKELHQKWSLTSLQEEGRITEDHEWLHCTTDVADLNVMVVVTLHVKQDLTAHLQSILFHICDILGILIAEFMWLHDQVVTYLFEECFNMREKVIMEHLCIYNEVLVVIRDLFFDPIWNIFRNWPEI